MRRIGKNGESLLKQNYIKGHETSLDEVFKRCIDTYISSAYQNIRERIYEYAKKGWFCFSTPALSNAGSPKSMPVACFLSKMGDTKEDISYTKKELEDLSFAGGGVAIDLSLIRSIGANITGGGKTAGITAQGKAIESTVNSAQQGGSNRRGACAIYLSIHHPEIISFLNIRKISTGGDIEQKTPKLHHAIIISDEFMEAMKEGKSYDLRCPHTQNKIFEQDAREMWTAILKMRTETGEPYLFFQGNADRNLPEIYKRTGRKVTQSNLCSEILLHTDTETTAVCVLLSVNLEYFDEWFDDVNFIIDMMRLLSGINGDFLYKVEKYMNDQSIQQYKKANYERAFKFAMMERSVGLGVMGWQYYLQKQNIAFDSEQAKELNISVFSHIRRKVDGADTILATEWGTSPLSNQAGLYKHFSLTMAIAPTESISQLLDTTPSIEPCFSNIFNKVIGTGTFTIKNYYLERLLDKYDKNTDETWIEIIKDGGSVKNLNFLTEQEKSVFKTGYEIDQKILVQQAGDRQKYIDQGQSLNLFIDSETTSQEIHQIHKMIYDVGLPTAYYLRSQPPIRAKTMECTNDICVACQ